MARPLRIAVSNGVYHVVARGNGRREIFRDRADREKFLEIFRDVLSRFGWRCLTYCLMGNHYHLVVRTPRPNLSRGMRQLNGVYAQRFNRRHGSCGHLFQGRFGGVLLSEDSHMLELARYVVLNPVRAGLCALPEEWPWSGHGTLIGESQDRLVSTRELLSHFSSDLSDARRRYRSFVGEGLDRCPPSDDELGAAAFDYLPAEPPSAEIPLRPWLTNRPPLVQILDAHDRDEAIAIAYRAHGYRLHEIAKALGCHYATVSRRLQAFEARTGSSVDQS